MSNLGIDDNLIRETQFLLIDRLVKLVINSFINCKYKVETEILQGLPISLILFLIYISNIFLEVERQVPNITYLSFMD